jgi:hypothetical protein
MDATRFDDLLRSFSSAASRRRLVAGLATALAAGSLAARVEEAAARCRPRCRQCERCRRGKCKPKDDRTACGSDDSRQCCDGKCCQRGDICVRGKCVSGQGTCATGADDCVSPAACNGVSNDECACLQTTSGAIRCVENTRIGDCGECESDEFCRQEYGPEAVCIDIGHGLCGCDPATPAWCMLPCPV